MGFVIHNFRTVALFIQPFFGEGIGAHLQIIYKTIHQLAFGQFGYIFLASQSLPISGYVFSYKRCGSGPREWIKNEIAFISLG